jgi:amidohydrolase family protein
MMRRLLLSSMSVGLIASGAVAQPNSVRPPVIDMHVHSTTTSPQQLSQLESLNIRLLFLAGLADDLRAWAANVDPQKYIPALVFPCERARAPITGRACYDGAQDFPDIAWLRGELQSGRIKAFGELEPQYLGLSPADPRLEPYWQLAEEFDIPVAIHMGPGPPGAAYDSNPSPFKSPNFRMAAGDPLLLEEVLLKHKRLRLYVMHAGWPRLGSMLALLYGHPNVYVDIAALQAPFVVPREGYYRYLRSLVENGFSKRIMFGSDLNSANQAGPGIDAVLGADFLTPEQKTDILCGNAARFLRLNPAICAP